MNTLILAAEGGVSHPGLWYPTIVGVLVVIAAVSLFCGSVYLLLATDLGARLGFQVAVAALSGFMVLLSLLWMTTASPLNTLKGRVPTWKPIAEMKTGNVSTSPIPAVQSIKQKKNAVPVEVLTNLKAFVDEAVVTKTAVAGVQPAASANKYAVFDASTDYIDTVTYLTGGGGRFAFHSGAQFPWLHFSFHTAQYAAADLCPVKQVTVTFGSAPPTPTCDTAQPIVTLVMVHDLGSVRIPPMVAFFCALILFGLSLLSLHWRERDLQEQAAAAEKKAAGDGRVPVPAKA